MGCPRWYKKSRQLATPAQQYERKKISSLFLFTSFGGQVGSTKGGQHGDTCANRGWLVAILIVLGQNGVTACAAMFFIDVAALEHSSAIGVGK